MEIAVPGHFRVVLLWLPFKVRLSVLPLTGETAHIKLTELLLTCVMFLGGVQIDWASRGGGEKGVGKVEDKRAKCSKGYGTA